MTPPLAPRGPGADGAPGTGGAPGIGGAPGSRGHGVDGAPGSPARRAVGAGVLAVGVVAAAVVLRAPITAVPPALHAISLDLGLSAAAAGATTSLPLVCFGIFAFVAPVLVVRVGLEATMVLLAVPLLVGVLLRSAGGAVAFYTGALLIGVGIAIGNVVLPALIRARFPGHLALMLGVYVAVLQISGAVGSALTDPLQTWLGWDWRPALAVWAVPVAALVPLWWWIAGRIARPGGPTRPPSGLGHVVRHRLPWAVTIFMAVQAAVFYSLLTWIPAHLTAQGVSTSTAGLVLGLFSLLGLPGAFIGPQFATGPHARLFIGTVYGVQAFSMLLFGLGPVVAVLAALLCGLCQGAGFSIALTFIADQPDPHDVPAVSAMAQGLGYLAAALGPMGLGAVYEATGSWWWPDLLVVAAALVVLVVGGAVGARIHRRHDLGRLRPSAGEGSADEA